jgi:photosystem II stability/assembly factor-like uncharacterized protein
VHSKFSWTSLVLAASLVLTVASTAPSFAGGASIRQPDLAPSNSSVSRPAAGPASFSPGSAADAAGPPMRAPVDLQASRRAALPPGRMPVPAGTAAPEEAHSPPIPPATTAQQEGAFARVGAWPYGSSSAVGVDPDRDLIFLGAGGACLILDGTDRTNPTLIYDQIRTDGVVNDIAYDRTTQRLYLACGEAGLDIWDVQNPSAPVLLSRTPILYYGFATPVATVELWQHFAVMSCQWGYVECADVSDPAHPVQTSGNGQMGNPAADVYVSPEDGSIHGTGPDYYIRFSISPSGVLTNQGAIDFEYRPGAGAVAATDQIACIGGGDYLFIHDLQSLNFPLLRTLNVGGVGDEVIQDGRLYLINSSGLQIWDLANPSNPVLRGTLAAAPAAPRRIAVSEGYAYLADGGLTIVQLGDGTAPVAVGSYETYAGSWSTEVSGDYAYVAEGTSGLRVLDISDLSLPMEAAHLDIPGDSRDLAIDGDRLYLAAGSVGLHVVDISDPTAPDELGADPDVIGWRVAVSGTKAYVLESISGEPERLRVLDVSDPSSIGLLGTYEFSPQVFVAWDLVVDGDYAYVAGHDGGVRILDVSDPAQITLVSTFAAPSVTGVYLDGNLLYVSANSLTGGLIIVDVSDPLHPQQVGEYEEQGFAPFYTVVRNGFAYCSDFSDLTLVSVVDPTTPQLLGETSTPGFFSEMASRDQYVYAADDDGGLQIYENLLYANPGVDWEPQESGSSGRLRNVYFTDTSHGWIVGEAGVVLSTANGGEKWVPHDAVTTSDLFGLWFLGENTGWITGGNGLAVGDGFILKTTDGGGTWSSEVIPPTERIRSIQFVNPSEGWAVGNHGLVIHSTNGGGSWQSQPSGTTADLSDVRFVDTLHGWAVGTSGTTIRTTNGGQSWQVVPISGQGYLASVDFVDPLNGWLTGSQASIYRTTDGGVTWVFQRDDPTTYSNLLDIDFLDADTGWTVGAVGIDGQSFTTIDAGNTWNAMRGGQEAYLYAVHFVDPEHGWAVGQEGTVLRTVSHTTGVLQNPALPAQGKDRLALRAGPNPFVGVTAIRYQLPAAERVSLRVYDAAGRQVRSLVDGTQPSGPQVITWDGRTDTGAAAGSGVYWCRLEAGTLQASGRIVRVR